METVINYIVVGIAIMLIMALALVLFFLLSQQKLNQAKIEQQAMELRHQQELLQRNLQVQEEERQRIAAQLHDDIGSKIGVLNLTFYRLQKIEGRDERDELHDEINFLLSETLNATRQISHELLPPTLEDFGLATAIDEFCEGIRKANMVSIHFENSLNRNETGNTTTELHIFRIIQEFTNNSLKYAGARNITIRLQKSENERQMVYEDDGCGFDPDKIDHKGLGMKNLDNRVKILNAQWTFETAPGNGFKAIVKF